MILESRTLDKDRFLHETGWEITDAGGCKGGVCIPLPEEARAGQDAVAIANAIGLPVVEDAEHGLISIGPESIGGHALTTATAQDIELPDLDGKPFALSSLRGQKVLVYAWAPY